MTTLGDFPLVGAGGEPISFARTIHSHGVARLPPAMVQSAPLGYRRRFRVGTRVVEVALEERNGRLVATSTSRLSARDAEQIRAQIARMFRFHDDLAPFYAKVADDELVGWAAAGAGRILASPTVFEDVIKTICTTNCAWSATVRMTTALAELGGGAFPEPSLLAQTSESWYRDVARMGYRGAYIKTIASDVSSGKLDLEALFVPGRYSDVQAEEILLGLPGIGPYGCAHVMQLLGRHKQLVLDSWTRPEYRRLAGKKQAADSTIRRAFARYGDYAGLAFWMFLTRDWMEQP